MNISKKALMSFHMVLTSLVAMAQPYYHIMKEENGKLIEETGYDSKDYKLKIDMDKPKPKDAVGGMITIESYDCDMSPLKRSFYFTKNGNVYYNKVYDALFFDDNCEYEIRAYYSDYHREICGHFYFCKNLKECVDRRTWAGRSYCQTETDFYFANPENLPKLQKDLGNERWGVLSACEWDYVCKALGESGWTVDGKTVFLIDTTPNKSLLTELRNKNRGRTSNLTVGEFRSLAARGLVCLPACGYFDGYKVEKMGSYGYYWSCTPSTKSRMHEVWAMKFGSKNAGMTYDDLYYSLHGAAVRLVILADD